MNDEEFKSLPIGQVLVIWNKYSTYNAEIFVKKSNRSMILIADTRYQEEYWSEEELGRNEIFEYLFGCQGRRIRNNIEVAPRWIQNCFEVK